MSERSRTKNGISQAKDKMWAEYNKHKHDPKLEAQYNARLRTLLSRSIDLKEASERGDDSCVKEATSIIQQADEVLRNAKCSSTAYLDAQILNTSSLVYKNCIEKMDSRISEFKANEYAENILRFLENKSGGGDIWSALEDETALLFNNTGGWTWQLGAVDIDEVPQGQRQQRQKRENLMDAPMKNPKKVQNLEKEEGDLENNMTAIVKAMLKWQNKNREPLQFWQLVLNPTSFSETIENIFHVSHLVKEGLVYISLDRDGLPVVKTMKSKGQNKDIDRIPIAVTVDVKQWKELVEIYDVKRPMIPERNHQQ